MLMKKKTALRRRFLFIRHSFAAAQSSALMRIAMVFCKSCHFITDV